MGLRIGDMVWARALYPHSWWPALVLRVDLFGVLVSFFASDPPPRYFLESEVRSFDRSFLSLIGTVNRGTPCDETLIRALLLQGRRAGLSFTCPCLEPPMKTFKEKNLAGVGWNCADQVLEAANSFLLAQALGFVLDAAVSPWIEDEGLLIAVTASALIKRFRRYANMKQKLMYLEENTVTISEEDDTLDLGDERQVLCEHVGNSKTDCITDRIVTKESLKPLHEVEVNCLQLKRQAEQPDPAHPCFKLRKTKPFFSLSRAYAYLQENGDSVKMGFYDAFTSGSLVSFDVPLIEHTSHCRSIVEIDNFKEQKISGDIVNGATFAASVNMVNAQGSNVSSKDEGKCKSHVDALRSTKGVWNVDAKVGCASSSVQPFSSSSPELLLNNVSGNHATNKEVGRTNVVTTKHLLLPHLNTDKDVIHSRNGDFPTSVTNNKELNMKFHQPVTADLSLISQLDQQPKLLVYGHSKILHMKFPKGYYRPSKEELIKKFSSFGSVDPLNTKVSPYTGAAKVVFLNHIDAVTAYQYAKRKKVFLAQGNVQFSLYPFNCKKEELVAHKREGVKRKATEKRKACTSQASSPETSLMFEALMEVVQAEIRKTPPKEPNEEVWPHNDEPASQHGGNRSTLQQYTMPKPFTRSDSYHYQKSHVSPTPIQPPKAKLKHKTRKFTQDENRVWDWVQTAHNNKKLAQFDSRTIIFGDTAATMTSARRWICNMLMRYACAWLNNSLFKHCQRKWAFPPQFGEIVASELGIPVSLSKDIQGMKWDISLAEKNWFRDYLIGFSLHSCDMVFHPVLLYKHWFLICLNIRAKRVEVLNSIPNYYNPEPGCPQKRVDFDRFLRREVEILGELVMSSSENPPQDTLRDLKKWKVVYPAVPVQPNLWDCGPYVINFMKLYDGDADRLADAFVNAKYQMRKQLLLDMLLSDVNKLKDNCISSC